MSDSMYNKPHPHPLAPIEMTSPGVPFVAKSHPPTNLFTQNRICLANEKLSSLHSVTAIAKMRNQNSRTKIAIANSVVRKATAEDLQLVLREVRDLVVVCALLGVSKGHDACDLVLDCRGQIFDGAVDDGGALAAVR